MPLEAAPILLVIIVVATVLAIAALAVAAHSWFERRRGEARAGLAALDLKDRQRLIEHLTAAWRQRGHRVEPVHAADDLVALRLHDADERWLVHCAPGPTDPVDLSVARQLLSAVAAQRAAGAIIVSCGEVGGDVRRCARGQPLRLIDATALWPLLESSLVAADRGRAQRRIRRWRGSRVGLPVVIGSGLAVVALGALVYLLNSDPADLSAQAATRTASASVAPTSPVRHPAAADSEKAHTGAPTDAAPPAARAAAEATAAPSDRTPAALHARRAALTAELERIDQVESVEWIAENRAVLSTDGTAAMNPLLADSACAALARFPELAGTQLELARPGASRGFESLQPSVGCH